MKKAFGALDTGAYSYEKQSDSGAARVVRSYRMARSHCS